MTVYAQFLKEQFDICRIEAEEAESTNDLKSAAALYRKSAILLKELANESNSPIKEQRLKTSEKLLELGFSLNNIEHQPRNKNNGKTNRIRDLPDEEETEVNELQSTILSLITRTDVDWKDVGGLKNIQNTIKEAIGLSYARFPENIEMEGWKNILFFGPPGTGKTLIASAVSNKLFATFFNVKVGQILSKYYGESSKLITTLFEIAKEKAPSVIFLDELDSIAVSRGKNIDEATRRTLSTLLSEMDGLSKKSRDLVLVMGATNTPWDLDEAVVSRFEKRLFIPLPDEEARREIIRIHTTRKGFDFEDIGWIAEKTQGFSGRDIRTLCKEAIFTLIRELNPEIIDMVDRGLEELEKYEVKTRALKKSDFKKALDKVRPASSSVEAFEKWNERYSSN